jgi:flagellar biosynthesis protein FlhG
MGLGNLDVLMNINSRYNISHVLDGSRELDEIIHPGPAGVEVICGGSGIENLANLSPFERRRLIDELDELQDSCDVMVIDTGAGINASVMNLCQAADHTLVVTTPEPTAMTDAYATIKVLSGRDYGGRMSLVVNMADSITEGKKIYRQIAEVAGRFLNVTVYEAGVLCKDESLVMSVREREPVVLSYPNSQISSSLSAMAARLWKGSATRTGTEGFFRKVVNWFF